MPTLKEAVESGRRYRYPGNTEWRGPGKANPPTLGTSLHLALDDCWQLEPEPEKPREWRLKWHRSAGYWMVIAAPDEEPKHDLAARVHDADACDRLRAKP
jgi:hypothetical protein